jgi:choline dehydrogenase-like flavoprotein
MPASNPYDVIIIGTGAGGGTLLHRLAPTGKRILVLERGDYVPREKDNWDAGAVNVRAKYNTTRRRAPLHGPRQLEEAHERLRAKLESLMKQQTKCPEHGHECHQGLFARSLFMGERIPLAGVAHQNGTVRFGKDPKTSALDVNCKAHDVDNLYVVDGSFFVSSAAVNPALTIMANALRVGDHLAARLK